MDLFIGAVTVFVMIFTWPVILLDKGIEAVKQHEQRQFEAEVEKLPKPPVQDAPLSRRDQ